MSGRRPLDVRTAEVYLELLDWTEWPHETLVVIPCAAAKLGRAAPAVELYRSSHFALGLAAARALTDDDWIRVLSARHGLVELRDGLEPYDTRWGGPDAVTVATVRVQSARIPAEVVVALTPRAYTDVVGAVWPDVVAPLAGCAGIGEQRHRLATIRDTCDKGSLAGVTGSGGGAR